MAEAGWVLLKLVSANDLSGSMGRIELQERGSFISSSLNGLISGERAGTDRPVGKGDKGASEPEPEPELSSEGLGEVCSTCLGLSGESGGTTA